MLPKLRSLLRWLIEGRTSPTAGAPPPPATPGSTGLGPYRRAGAPPGATPSRPGEGPQFTGYQRLCTIDDDRTGYAKYLVHAPEPPHRRALTYFHVDPTRSDPGFVTAFDEARYLTQVTGRGRVIELGNDGLSYWHLAEYPRGATLGDIFARIESGGAPPDLDVAIAAFGDFAAELDAARRLVTERGEPLGLRYRGLSPNALLFSAEGLGAVVDWGLTELVAIHRAHTSGPGGVTGINDVESLRHQLIYRAPEELRGLPVDSRADMFALGLMLHHLTTGRRPELRADLSRESVVRPSALVPGYPGDLEEVVMSAVDLDPARRVAVGELASGLRAVLAGRGVEDGAMRVAEYVSGCSGAAMVEG